MWRADILNQPDDAAEIRAAAQAHVDTLQRAIRSLQDRLENGLIDLEAGASPAADLVFERREPAGGPMVDFDAPDLELPPVPDLPPPGTVERISEAATVRTHDPLVDFGDFPEF